MKTLFSVMGIVVCLGTLTGCQTTPPLQGNSVSSGEFYDVVTQWYTKTLPPLVMARDVDAMFAASPAEPTRYKIKVEDGTHYDYTGQKARLAKEWAESMGVTWNPSFKIENVTMTDETHGMVKYTAINDWENTTTKAAGRFQRPSVNQWEKIDGQWRIVYAEQGRSTSTRLR